MTGGDLVNFTNQAADLGRHADLYAIAGRAQTFPEWPDGTRTDSDGTFERRSVRPLARTGDNQAYVEPFYRVSSRSTQLRPRMLWFRCGMAKRMHEAGSSDPGVSVTSRGRTFTAVLGDITLRESDHQATIRRGRLNSSKAMVVRGRRTPRADPGSETLPPAVTRLSACRSLDGCAVAEQVLNGLVVGMVYVLLAAGLSIIFGVMDVINFAHGELFALGAYFAFAIAPPRRRGLLGRARRRAPPRRRRRMGIERLTVKRLYGRDPLYHILLTFGLVLIVNDLITSAWGKSAQLAVPDYLDQPVSSTGCPGVCVQLRHDRFRSVARGSDVVPAEPDKVRDVIRPGRRTAKWVATRRRPDPTHASFTVGAALVAVGTSRWCLVLSKRVAGGGTASLFRHSLWSSSVGSVASEGPSSVGCSSVSSRR